jgi:iron complex outermembrane receptor protein
LNFLDDFILKGGIRYDNVSVNVPDFTQLLAPNGTGGKFINGGKINFDAFTFNTGLRYAKLDAFKPYVSFSQGFSIIDVGRFVRSAKENDIAKMDIDPVIVNSYEAGFHSKVGIVSFSGAYFVSTSKLGSSLQANADNTVYSIQRAPERVHGFEAVVDVFISKRLQWGASGAYAEGKADIDDNGSFSNETDKYLNGTRISPPKITSYVDYRPIDKLSLNLQWIYSGERKRFDPNPSTNRYMVAEGPVSSFSIFNFTAGYQFTDKISASLGIENLLNETYFLPVAYWNARDEDYMHANGARYQIGVSFKW